MYTIFMNTTLAIGLEQMFDASPKITDEFINGNLTMSCEGKILPLDDEGKKAVKCFMAKYGEDYIIYHLIKSKIYSKYEGREYTVYSFVILDKVDPYKTHFQSAANYPNLYKFFAYVYNVERPEYSERGYIVFKVENGIFKRLY